MKKLLLIALLIVGCEEPTDCTGVSGGDAEIDDCGLCTGGTTGQIANYLMDGCGVCGGDGASCSGCTNPLSENYNIDATIDDGSCIDNSVTLFPDFTTILLTDENGDSLGYTGSGIYGECYEFALALTTDQIIPTSNTIANIFPNPFANTISINISNAVDQEIEISIINSNNDNIADIYAGNTAAGSYLFTWDGASSGQLVEDGYYRVIANFGSYECFQNIKFEHNNNGCTDSNACNYDQYVTVDDGSCIYEEDCNGVCGGDAEVDICGICDGDGISDGECDCDGNVVDNCGICAGDGSECEGMLPIYYSTSCSIGVQFDLIGVDVTGVCCAVDDYSVQYNVLSSGLTRFLIFSLTGTSLMGDGVLFYIDVQQQEEIAEPAIQDMIIEAECNTTVGL